VEPSEALREVLSAELAEIRSRGLYRSLQEVEVVAGTRAQLNGRSVRVFGSNDYLGLAGDDRVRTAAAEAVERWGSGSTGSRATTGCLEIHRELERELASLKGAEDALLFPSGYQAALGTIPALVGRGDLIVSDRWNHACLIDGCRLSRAEIRVYRHADCGHAAELLSDRERFRRVLLVTDGVFSMDGDLAPVPELVRLARSRDAWLMVDDAHGTGVIGPEGAGTAAFFGLEKAVPIQMATLSKALGVQGGFIAGSGELIDYLRNRCRSYLFTTAPAPAVSAAALAAVRIARAEEWRRERLRQNRELLQTALGDCGVPVPESPAAILPVVLGSAEAAVSAAWELEARGIWAPAIRPPTVPEGTARLRVTLSAAHTDEDLTAAAAAFRDVLRRSHEGCIR
jgi:8-amino-7-oxononanoate synthase